MEVYVDILILENIIMNYIILWVTAKFSKEPTSFLKMFISAFFGALYCLLMFFPSLKIGYTLFLKILFSFLLIVIAFHPYKVRQFIRLISIFYIVSFVFGGAAFALFYFTNIGAVISNGVFYITNFPIKILFGSSLLAYIVIRFAWTTITNKFSKENMYVVIDILLDGKRINLKGLIDTGNSLYDPISKSPVIIAELEAINEILPSELTEIFSESKENDIFLISNVLSSSEWATRFRLIPFSSLGMQNGMLIGFKPDEVLVDRITTTKEIKDIVVGIYNNKLSKDGSYNALLHPQIIN